MITEIGPHRLRHGNLHDGIGDLMLGERADIVYADPPWGPGNLKFWQTMNHKMTGAEPLPTDIDAFLDCVLATAELALLHHALS